MEEIMTTYKRLLRKVEKEVPVIESSLPHDQFNLDGVWKNINGKDYIIIDGRLSDAAKARVLAEEYGHVKTSVGVMMNYDDPSTAKQEHEARVCAAGELVSLDDIVSVLEGDSMTFNEIAYAMDVTPEELACAYDFYRDKFGDTFTYGGVYFDLRDIDNVRMSRID